MHRNYNVSSERDWGLNDVMHVPKLAMAVVAVSISVVAQTRQQHGYGYICEPELKYKNPFPHTAVIEQQSTLLHTGIDLTKVIPPTEFRRLIKARAVSQRTSFWPPEPPLGLPPCPAWHLRGRPR
jgi:hypothetical protein